jgi:hypothetical protein
MKSYNNALKLQQTGNLQEAEEQYLILLDSPLIRPIDVNFCCYFGC